MECTRVCRTTHLQKIHLNPELLLPLTPELNGHSTKVCFFSSRYMMLPYRKNWLRVFSFSLSGSWLAESTCFRIDAVEMRARVFLLTVLGRAAGVPTKPGNNQTV